MSGPWARHFQTVWQERAGDVNLPDWLRVAALAYGTHAENGHALQRPGNVALVLARVDPSTGEVTPQSRQNVYRAIQAAIRHQWLAEGSTARCLIVPAHAISKGTEGGRPAPCPQHDAVAARKARHLRAVPAAEVVA